MAYWNDIARNLERLLNARGTHGTLFRGTSVGLVMSGGSLLAAFGMNLVLARVMGPAQFGAYVYVIAWMQVLVFLPLLGIDQGLLRFIPEYAGRADGAALKGILRWSLRTVSITGLTAGALAAVSIRFFGFHENSEIRSVFLVGTLLLPLMSVLVLESSALRAFKKIALYHLHGELAVPVLLGLSAASVHMMTSLRLDGETVMGIHVVIVAAVCASSVLFLRASVSKNVEPKESPKILARRWFRVSVPMSMMKGLQIVLARTDIVMVGILVGIREAGIYAVASRMARLLTFGLSAANSIAAPLISELYAQEKHRDLQIAVNWVCRVAFALTILIALILVPGRVKLLGLFGEPFVRGGNIFLILAAGRMVDSFSGPVGFLLTMTGHQDTGLKINATVAFLNIILNVPAVYYFGMHGAALATSIIIAVQNIWRWIEVRRRIGILSWAVAGQGAHKI